MDPITRHDLETILRTNPENVEAIDRLKDGKSPAVQKEIDEVVVSFRDCYRIGRAGKSPAECLAEVTGGNARVARAKEICDDFLRGLAVKKVRLTGNIKIDRGIIKKEWEEYKKTHKDKPGMKDAEEALDRWFDVAPLISMNTTFSVTKQLRDATGLVMAAALLGLDILSFFPELRSDNAFLGFFMKALSFGKMDLDGINSDLGGTINLKNTAFGMLNQVLYNPFLDSWLEGFSDEKRPLAQQTLTFVTLLGLFRTHQLQTDLLDTTWAERRQPEVRSMVEQLMQYLFVHGDMGLVPQAHRWMPEINRESSVTTDVLSFTLRGGLAVLIGLNAVTNARMHVKSAAEKAVIPDPDAGQTDSESQTFLSTSRSIAENDSSKSFAMMMNDALIMSDIIMETVHDLMGILKSKSRALKYSTPVAAFALVTLVFGLAISKKLHDNPAPAIDPDTDSLLDYIRKYRLNMTPGELEVATGSASKMTFWAFFIGGVEAIAAGYSENRRDIVDAFALVNNMLGTNSSLARTAAESEAAFENSGQGSGDPYHALTRAMGVMWMLDLLASVWAGTGAGMTASLSNKPWMMEYWPAYAGLAIRIAYLTKAYNIPEGVGHDAVVKQQWLNLGVYLGTAAMSFVASRLLGVKINPEFRFRSGGYEIAGKIAPSPAGIGIAGTFGSVVAPKRKTIAEQLAGDQAMLDRINEESRRIRELLAGKGPLPDGADRETLQKRLEELSYSAIALQADIAQKTADALSEQEARLAEASRGPIIPFDADNPDQRKLIAGELITPLEQRRAVLEAEITAIKESGTTYTRTQSFFAANPFRFQPSQRPLSEEKLVRLATLRKQLRGTDETILRTNRGGQQELADLYREKTGVDLNLTGFNPVVKKYVAELASQRRQVAAIARLLKTFTGMIRSTG